MDSGLAGWMEDDGQFCTLDWLGEDVFLRGGTSLTVSTKSASYPFVSELPTDHALLHFHSNRMQTALCHCNYFFYLLYPVM